MKIAIVVLAHDADVLAFFEKQKGAVIPKELRSGGIQFNPVPLDATCCDEELNQLLVNAHEKHDAVGLLVEDRIRNRIDCYRGAVFSMTFCAEQAKSSLKNYFGHSLNRWIKNLVLACKAFSDGKKVKCLLLPAQSFDAPEIKELFDIVDGNNNTGKFPELFETTIKKIRDRSIPKKKKSGEKHYLKDDNERYFELGKERHGQSETARPPHSHTCILSATARFGVSVNRHLHYNVSFETGQIGGIYYDCHYEAKNVSDCSHLNIFPNGFIR